MKNKTNAELCKQAESKIAIFLDIQREYKDKFRDFIKTLLENNGHTKNNKLIFDAHEEDESQRNRPSCIIADDNDVTDAYIKSVWLDYDTIMVDVSSCDGYINQEMNIAELIDEEIFSLTEVLEYILANIRK